MWVVTCDLNQKNPISWVFEKLHFQDKYMVSTKDFNVYKTNLYLNISLTEPADFGSYYCISKNEKGLTKAAIELFGQLL